MENLPDESLSVLWYSHNGVVSKVSNLSAILSEIKRVVKKRAPVVWRICCGLGKKTNNSEAWVERSEVVTLSSVLNLLYGRNMQANMWQTVIGIFYYASGIQKVGLEALHELGACPSYMHLNSVLHKLADSEREQLKSEAKRRPYLIQLDNVNRVSWSHVAW